MAVTKTIVLSTKWLFCFEIRALDICKIINLFSISSKTLYFSSLYGLAKRLIK